MSSAHVEMDASGSSSNHLVAFLVRENGNNAKHIPFPRMLYARHIPTMSFRYLLGSSRGRLSKSSFMTSKCNIMPMMLKYDFQSKVRSNDPSMTHLCSSNYSCNRINFLLIILVTLRMFKVVLYPVLMT